VKSEFSNKELTDNEKRMLDFIPWGKKNALISDRIQELFHNDGNMDVDDTFVRDIIRGLVNNHLIPIVGDSRGFYFPENEEEAMACENGLLSRIKEIAKRKMNFSKAWRKNPIWKIKQEEQMNLFLAESVEGARSR